MFLHDWGRTCNIVTPARCCFGPPPVPPSIETSDALRPAAPTPAPHLCRLRDLCVQHGQPLPAPARHQDGHGRAGRRSRPRPDRHAARHAGVTHRRRALSGANRLSRRSAGADPAGRARLCGRGAMRPGPLAFFALLFPVGVAARLRRDHPECRGGQDRVPDRPADHEPRPFLLEHRLLQRRHRRRRHRPSRRLAAASPRADRPRLDARRRPLPRQLCALAEARDQRGRRDAEIRPGRPARSSSSSR